MVNQKLPSFWIFLWISLILALIGWGGLAYLFLYTLPTLGPRWLFFFLVTVALSGTALPLVYFFNRRFPSDPPVDGSIILREAMWVGIYGSLLAWFQMGRVLTSGLAVVLAVGLVLVEFLMRLGDRSAWNPGKAEPAPGDEDDDEVEERYA